MLHIMSNIAYWSNLLYKLPCFIMLLNACNMAISDNNLIREGIRQLRSRLPNGWILSDPAIAPAPGVDATATLKAPDGQECNLVLEAKAKLEPKGARSLIEVVAAHSTRSPVVVVARYLSSGTKERLRHGGVSYLDLTGNTHIVVASPGLYIDTQGANEDPNREERPARSLRGTKAGRIVRALVDCKRPPGVRELATLTKLDAGYVSRVLAFLDAEALVTRVGYGRMQSVEWPALLRRWAQEAPLDARGMVQLYLEPRGLSTLLARMTNSDERYVVTGSLAAEAYAPTAPARLAMVWIRDATAAAARLKLRSVESGANVLLIEPNDDVVFDGAVQKDKISYAAPSQVAADLLTSPGRGPAEGEALIAWMQANEELWRR